MCLETRVGRRNNRSPGNIGAAPTPLRRRCVGLGCRILGWRIALSGTRDERVGVVSRLSVGGWAVARVMLQRVGE